MLNPVKLTAPDDKIFLWSDMHVGHARPWVMQARGFNTIEEHDEALISRWNAVVPDDGVVFHLGDMTFEDPNGKKFESLARRLRYRQLYHLWGNHTSGAKAVYRKVLTEDYLHPDIYANIELYPMDWLVDGDPNHVVTFVPQYLEVSIRKTSLVLCHYPINSWNGMAHGSLHCYAHCHGNLKHVMPNRLDVGVDSFPNGPVSLATIKLLTKGHIPEIVDHHGAI